MRTYARRKRSVRGSGRSRTWNRVSRYWYLPPLPLQSANSSVYPCSNKSGQEHESQV